MTISESLKARGMTMTVQSHCLNRINPRVVCGGDPIGHLCLQQATVMVQIGEHGNYPMCQRCVMAVGSHVWPMGLHEMERSLYDGQTATWRRPS